MYVDINSVTRFGYFRGSLIARSPVITCYHPFILIVKFDY